MADENQVTPPPGNDWEHSLAEIDTPRVNELSVGTVLEYHHKKIQEAQRTNIGWRREDILNEIKRDVEFQEPILRGPIQIAQGENLIIALTSRQGEATYILYGSGLAEIIMDKHYAVVETTGQGPKRLEVPIKALPMVRTKTQNHFLISAGLARQLEVDETAELKILDVYQKAEEINLDRI